MEGLIQIPRVDLIIHSKGGWSKTVGMEDDNGASIDVSGQAWAFKTETGLNIALTVDPVDPLSLQIVIPQAGVQAIFDQADHTTKYVLVDTGATPDQPLCFGRVVVEGW